MLRSFYNYLRYHRVCPEYDEQLHSSLQMCDSAERELTKVNAAGLRLPGDFNTSASTLFGGSHAGLYTGDKSWAQDMEKEGLALAEIGMRDQEARIKFSTGVVAMGTDDQQHLLGASLKIVKKELTGLEVLAVSLPDDNTREVYATQNGSVKNKLGHLESLGKLLCKTWYVSDCDEWDLPKDKYPDGKPTKVNEKKYEFWVEEGVMNECFVGMKLKATVITLESSTTILDDVMETYCSFYTWLPNELWMENKPKEVRWLTKGMAEHEEVEINGTKQDGQKKAPDGDEYDDE